MSLGNNIRKYRNVNQLRQIDLAKMIGKSTRMLQKYEAGEVTPSLEVIELLAEKLGIDFYDLKHRKPSTTWHSGSPPRWRSRICIVSR